MSLKDKYGYDVKYVVFQHECVDVGCFEHIPVKLFDPLCYDNPSDAIDKAKRYAETLKCKQIKQDPIKSLKCLCTLKQDKPKDKFLIWLNNELAGHNLNDKSLSDYGKGYREAIRWTRIEYEKYIKE